MKSAARSSSAPPISLLYSFPAIIVGLVHAYLPYMILTCYLSAVAIDEAYIEAARSIGASDWTIIVRHILPGTISSVVVYFTMRIGTSIITAASLSFLGLGAQPPKAEWGSMVAEGTQYFQYWWIGTFPGLAIFTVVLAFNFLGDSLRDVFDPQTAWRSQETQP